MTLFQRGDFTLNSGQKSKWKIECDALTADDWAGLAAMAVERLPPFGAVMGVPRGGLPFEAALRPYCNPLVSTFLVADDVLTTGGSMIRFLQQVSIPSYKSIIGICVFARGEPMPWVMP